MTSVRKLLSLLLILSLVLVASTSCSTVRRHCEISIDLPSRFTDYDSGKSFDLAYSDGSIIVGILRLSFDACLKDNVPITMSPESFAAFYRKSASGVDGLTEVEVYGDVPYFSYELDGEGSGRYFYMPTFYVSPYAYFVISFITDVNFVEGAKNDIFSFIDTVRINNNVQG